MKRASSYGMKPFPMASSDVERMPRQKWEEENTSGAAARHGMPAPCAEAASFMQAAQYKKWFESLSQLKRANFYPFTGGSACDAIRL